MKCAIIRIDNLRMELYMKKICLLLCLLIIGIGTLTVLPLEANAAPLDRPATESDFIGNETCGGTGFEFHPSLPNFTSTLYDLLKIATPVIIIITGMMDMLKAVSAQKEDEIKKAQQKFVRRLLAGVVVFLVFVIVETVINTFVESTDATGAMQCVNCFLSGGPCNN